MSETMVEYETKGEDLTILERCQNLEIKTLEDFEKSAEWYAICDTQIKEIDKRWKEKEVIEIADRLHKKLCKERTDDKAPWLNAKNIISAERNRYQVEEDIRREEAQKKAEALEEEKKDKELDKLLGQAVKLEEKGKIKQAEEKLEQAENVFAEPVFVPSTVTKKVVFSFGGSVSSQKDFDVEVTDIKSICKAVYDDKLPVGIIEIKNNELKTYCKLKEIKNGDIEGLLIKTKFRDINRK